MDNDRELLELAAKAAKIDGRYASLDEFPDWMTVHDGEGVYYTSSQAWNPLTDDGDALQLAIKLGMNIYTGHIKMIVELPSDGDDPAIQTSEPKLDDPCAAARRAIVRAAAEIGRSKND